MPQTENGEKCGEKSFYMFDFQKTFHTKLRQMLSSHSAVCLLDSAFVLLRAHLAVHELRKSIKKQLNSAKL